MKNFLRFVFFTGFIISVFACGNEEIAPKPKAQLRLEYPPAAYETFRDERLPFTFDKSVYARVLIKSDTTFDIVYPDMHARFYCTYAPVQNNLRQLLSDADKLTYKHAIKAEGFAKPRIFENPEKGVFARINRVTGNAASPLQFLVTDSTRHFVNGSLYFQSVPNYDSIRPPLRYLEKDLKHLIETWQWVDSGKK